MGILCLRMIWLFRFFGGCCRVIVSSGSSSLSVVLWFGLRFICLIYIVIIVVLVVCWLCWLVMWFVVVWLYVRCLLRVFRVL